MTSNQPTLEFRDHHDLDPPRVDEREFRQGWRVRSRLDQLLTAERITRDEWQAARDYALAWAFCRTIRHTDSGMTGIPSSASPGALEGARLDAATKLRIVEEAMGGFATALVVACAVQDLPWARIARPFDVNPETVRDWTVLAIRALTAASAGATRPEGSEPLR